MGRPADEHPQTPACKRTKKEAFPQGKASFLCKPRLFTVSVSLFLSLRVALLRAPVVLRWWFLLCVAGAFTRPGGFALVVSSLCGRPFHPPRFSYRRGAWGCLCFLKSSGFAAFDRPKAAEKPPLFRSGGNPAALILRFAPGASGFLIRPHSDAADPRHKAERRLENDAKRTQRAARQTVGRTHHFLNASWDRKRAGRRKVCAIGVRWAVSGSVAFRKWFLPCVRDAFTHTGFPHLVRRM